MYSALDFYIAITGFVSTGVALMCYVIYKDRNKKD